MNEAASTIFSNPWLAGGAAGLWLWTNYAMSWLKGKFPYWTRKAWAPPVIAGVTGVLAGMATGEIGSTADLTNWVLISSGVGTAASSARDVYVGK